MRLTGPMLLYMKAHAGSLEGYVMPPRRKNEESVMQRALIRWWRSNCGKFGVPEMLLFSVPNGFNGDARRGSVMKAEGQRKGCPDLVLAVAQNHDPNLTVYGMDMQASTAHALFLELKTPRGVLSPEQVAFHAALQAQGYRVEVCRSLVEACAAITAYLT